MKVLFFDTETTGLPKGWVNALTEGVWPDIVSVSWILCDKNGSILTAEYYIIKPDGWVIPPESTNIHKITEDMANEHGQSLDKVLSRFYETSKYADILVAHNLRFDQNVIDNALLWRLQNTHVMRKWGKRLFCTMKHGAGLLQLPGNYGKFKYPKLWELYAHATGKSVSLDILHNALQDTLILKECFFRLWSPSDLPDVRTLLDNANGKHPALTKLVLSLADTDETV
jgi:hypothetical protein